MSVFTTSATTADLSTGRIAQIATNLFGTIASWNDARVTRNALSKLSAHELADIGLTFGDIEAIATRAAR